MAKFNWEMCFGLESHQYRWVEEQALINHISKNEVGRRAISHAMNGPHTIVREVKVEVIKEVEVEVIKEVRESKTSFRRRANKALQLELQNWSPPGHYTVKRIISSFLENMERDA